MQRVFISSTFLDLKLERAAIRDVLLRMGFSLLAMEYFGSDSMPPMTRSLSLLENATIYLGIIAHRYGRIVEDTGKSITHMEYDKARQMNIATLVYIKDSKVAVEPTEQFIDFDETQRRSLGTFKEQILSENTVTYFKTPDELAAIVAADLAAKVKLFPDETNMTAKEDLIPLIGSTSVGKSMLGIALTQDLDRQPAPVHEIKLQMKVEFSRRAKLLGERLAAGIPAPKTPIPLPIPIAKFSLTRTNTELNPRHWHFHMVDISGEVWLNWQDEGYSYGRDSKERPRIILNKSSALAICLEVFNPQSRLGNYSSDLPTQHDVLAANTIRHLASEYRPLRFPRPVALVLTKCDLAPSLLNDSRSKLTYLSEIYPRTLEAARENLRTWKLFSTSTYGLPSDDSERQRYLDPSYVPMSVKPVGVWAPVFWLLSRI